MTPEVGGPRLSDGERHSPAACVGGREVLSFPERDRIAMQVSESRFVKKVRVNDHRVINLAGHGPSRVPSRDARRVRSADVVLWIVVVKPIYVETAHQRLPRRELVVQPPVEEKLAVMTCVVEAPARRQQKGRQRAREERRSILPRVVSRGEE